MFSGFGVFGVQCVWGEGLGFKIKSQPLSPNLLNTILAECLVFGGFGVRGWGSRSRRGGLCVSVVAKCVISRTFEGGLDIWG